MTDVPLVAVVGAACRFPGAANIDEFWANLNTGRDCVTREYDVAGELTRAGGAVDDLEGFDTHLFKTSAREAALLDPQHRMFLECCWSALESAGIAPASVEATTGLFGGSGISTYLINNVLPAAVQRTDRTFVDASEDLQMLMAIDKEYLSSRVAYRLDFRGPVLTVQAACATGLFAVHMAVQSLLNGECDLALAGASSASVPQLSRHGAEPGMVLSDDGFCRSYDADASGTVFGSGAGVVVLKLLEDARRDGDPVLAVVRGSAVNNDGSAKAGMAAPSISGQASVIADALAVSGIEPGRVSYIEGHGTATPVGDPIEITALNNVFDGCAPESISIGSVKSSIGHLGTAAGMAGFIKTVLCLHHRTLVPTLHFAQPNPEAPWSQSPFRVQAEATPWPAGDEPRVAGVSAFGLGGANAHIVLEEALPEPVTRPTRQPSRVRCVPLSAASPDALRAAAADLATVRDVDLPDVATTLSRGREHLKWRTSLAVGDPQELTRSLEAIAAGRRSPREATRDPELGLLFTGYCPGESDLSAVHEYDCVRAVLAEADPIMHAETGVTASAVLLGDTDRGRELVVEQPAQFVFQAALFELWRSWGVHATTVAGHSLGEFGAAYAAGVLDLAGGIRLVAHRSRLLASLPEAGAMATVSLHVDDVTDMIRHTGARLSIAAVNGPANTVISGPAEDIAVVCGQAEERGARTKQLGFGTAGHSTAVDAVVDEFAEIAAQVPMKPPSLQVISALDGELVGDEMSRAAYWVRQMRHTVQFAAVIDQLENIRLNACLEIGPVPVLSGMYAAAVPDSPRLLIPTARSAETMDQTLAISLGTLFELGVPVNWAEVDTVDSGRRRRLPGYRFDRSRHWIDAPALDGGAELPAHRIRWDQAPTKSEPLARGHWLVLSDSTGVGAEVEEALTANGHLVTTAADLNLPADPECWTDGIRRYLEDPPLPLSGVLSFTALEASRDIDAATSLQPAHDALLLLQAATRSATGPVRTWLFTRSAVATRAGEQPCPAQAAVPALARSAAREFPAIPCTRVDLPAAADTYADLVLDALSTSDEADVAYRDGQRYVRRIVAADTSGVDVASLAEDGVYLVTGGFSDIGVLTAAALLRRGAGEVVLAGRRDDGEQRRADVRERLGRLVGPQQVLRLLFDYADMTNADEVRDLVQRSGSAERPLRGVIHAAGALRDATLHGQGLATLAEGFAVKAFGAVNLHMAVQGCDSLDLFTCFTSATGIVGNAGQSNYAAANAFVEALIDSRVATGLPGQCLAWGPWLETGHLARDSDTRTALMRSGMGGLTNEVGERAITTLIGASSGTTALLANDWTVWRRGSNPREERSFTGLISIAPVAAEERTKQAEQLIALLADGGREQARTLAEETVAEVVADVLGASPDHATNLQEYGLDSLSAVQLRNGLAHTFDLHLPVDVCLRQPDVRGLADHLLERIAAVSDDTQTTDHKGD